MRYVGGARPDRTDTKFFRHESAILDNVIDDGSYRPVIGNDTRVWAFAHVMPGVQIGDRCTIGEGVHVGWNVRVGNGCKIQNGAQIFTGVAVEDDVFIGPHVVFTNVKTPRAFVSRKEEFAPTEVKRGASIGANATIVCGVTIGEYAMIGAGAVVTSNVEAHALVVGAPATGVGWVCRCGDRFYGLRFYPEQIQRPCAVSCKRCGEAYTYSGNLRRTEVSPDAKATP